MWFTSLPPLSVLPPCRLTWEPARPQAYLFCPALSTTLISPRLRGLRPEIFTCVAIQAEFQLSTRYQSAAIRWGLRCPLRLSAAPAGTECSQVTEIYNPNVTPGTPPPNPPFDFLLVSVQANGSANGCAGGACVMNLIVTQWQKNNAYTLGQEIMDNLSPYHIQRVTTAGTSGATEPGASWNHAGSTTTDGTVKWTDEGLVLATANSTGLPAAGGTSGIVVDNVLTGTGFSQFYFSTLANSPVFRDHRRLRRPGVTAGPVRAGEKAKALAESRD